MDSYKEIQKYIHDGIIHPNSCWGALGAGRQDRARGQPSGENVALPDGALSFSFSYEEGICLSHGQLFKILGRYYVTGTVFCSEQCGSE